MDTQNIDPINDQIEKNDDVPVSETPTETESEEVPEESTEEVPEEGSTESVE